MPERSINVVLVMMRVILDSADRDRGQDGGDRGAAAAAEARSETGAALTTSRGGTINTRLILTPSHSWPTAGPSIRYLATSTRRIWATVELPDSNHTNHRRCVFWSVARRAWRLRARVPVPRSPRPTVPTGLSRRSVRFRRSRSSFQSPNHVFQHVLRDAVADVGNRIGATVTVLRRPCGRPDGTDAPHGLCDRAAAAVVLALGNVLGVGSFSGSVASFPGGNVTFSSATASTLNESRSLRLSFTSFVSGEISFSAEFRSHGSNSVIETEKVFEPESQYKEFNTCFFF